MIGVQNKGHVQCIGRLFRRQFAAHQIKKVLCLGEIIAHRRQGFFVAGAMKIRGDDANLCGDAPGAAFVDFPRGHLIHLGIVETEHGNGRAHHVHWLGCFRRSFY